MYMRIYMYIYICVYIYIYTYVYIIPSVPEKLDQNKMSINLCFIREILFMNSFLILMFF